MWYLWNPHPNKTDLNPWLVVAANPSEKCESVGMLTFPTEWINKIHVPNRQPDPTAHLRYPTKNQFLAGELVDNPIPKDDSGLVSTHPVG